MRKQYIVFILLMLSTVASYGVTGTFIQRTPGASDTTKVVDLVNPQIETLDTLGAMSDTGDNASLPVTLTNLGAMSSTADNASLPLALTNLGAMKNDGSNASDTTTLKGLNLTGFTTLGELGTGLKCKIATGTTGAAEGNEVVVLHGLTPDKIVSWSAKVQFAAGFGVEPAYTKVAEYEYGVLQNATQMAVGLSATNSGNILSKPFTILIWYKE